MGAHQPHLGLGVPDQDVSQGSAQSLDWPGGDQPNILPLDLTFTFKTLYFDVNLFTFSMFLYSWSSSHCRLVRRACFVVTVISYR